MNMEDWVCYADLVVEPLRFTIAVMIIETYQYLFTIMLSNPV